MPKYDAATIERLDDIAYQIRVLATKSMAR